MVIILLKIYGARSIVGIMLNHKKKKKVGYSLKRAYLQIEIQGLKDQK